MLIYDDASKKCHVVITFCFLFLLFWKFVSYLVCVPNFKSVNNNFLSRKKFYGRNCTFTVRQRLRDQKTSVEIGLIELTEPLDTLNYNSYFKHCHLQTVLHVLLFFILVWKKIFCSKNWAVFYIIFILYLSLGGIQCYSIKGSVFLVLYV